MAPFLSSGSGDAGPAGSSAAPGAPRAPSSAQEALFAAVKLRGRHNCLAAIYAALRDGALVAAEDGNGLTALHIAAGQNKDAEAAAAAIKMLVEEGAVVDATGGPYQEPALHLAMKNPSAAAAIAALRALLAAGADALAQDRLGRVALHRIAVLSGPEAVEDAVQQLVAAGMDINARSNSGQTALHHVARVSKAGVAAAAVQALAGAGADAHLKDSAGAQPLHLAVQNKNNAAAVAAAAALVAVGADPYAFHGLEDGSGSGSVKCAAQLALERQDINADRRKQLLQALLGEAADDDSRQPDGAGPSSNAGSSNGPGLRQLTAAAIGQLCRKRAAEAVGPECPVCYRSKPYVATTCGHLFCEACSEQPQVQKECPVCRKRRPKYTKIFALA